MFDSDDYVFFVVPEIETSRKFWAEIAKQNGWYTEPFYIQVFVDPKTNLITDSVSSRILERDIIVYQTIEEGEE